ncbi:vacuolar protein sorting-associated protein 26-domain-containing protein [Lactarius hengduanensis]|nr:vacuolar protein sorting-associated protein 26-domain-containing protein [Lactarius hengduanensis]KAH9028972.1 vacuolar protein sorting-associated protein 26-domain-containing protein [Lactarius pseudohatsudake]
MTASRSLVRYAPYPPPTVLTVLGQGRSRSDGMKVEFVGDIELFYDRGHHQEFLSLSQEVPATGAAARELSGHERQAYFIRVTMSQRMADVVKESDIWVHSFRMPPDRNNPIKMEVGIEDCLHIEFEYNKSKYHLKDVIVGKIYFLLMHIKTKHMELSIIRRETTGSPPSQYNESETITKFEIMDGPPVRGIPFFRDTVRSRVQCLDVRESTAR